MAKRYEDRLEASENALASRTDLPPALKQYFMGPRGNFYNQELGGSIPDMFAGTGSITMDQARKIWETSPDKQYKNTSFEAWLQSDTNPFRADASGNVVLDPAKHTQETPLPADKEGFFDAVGGFLNTPVTKLIAGGLGVGAGIGALGLGTGAGAGLGGEFGWLAGAPEAVSTGAAAGAGTGWQDILNQGVYPVSGDPSIIGQGIGGEVDFANSWFPDGTNMPGLSGESMFPAGQNFNVGGAAYGLDAAGGLSPMATDFAGGLVPAGAAAAGAPDWLKSILGMSTPAAAVAGGLSQLTGEEISPGFVSALGGLAGLGLGYYGPGGAQDQQQQVERMYQDYSSMGAPYRAELQKLSADPSSFFSSSPYQQALDYGMQARARALSADVGNPILNQTAKQELANFGGAFGLDAYNQRWNQLANAGQLGSNQAASLGLGGVNAMGQANQTLGAGLQSVFGQNPDYTGIAADILRQYGLGSMLQGRG